jgi:Fic family protein
MSGNDWELIQGPVAQEIELLNYASQMNVVAGLVKSLLAQQSSSGGGMAPMPDEAALCQLHHAATLFLVVEPGCYRTSDVNVAKAGTITYQPPPWQDVKDHMQRFFLELASIWMKDDALDVAAYALWRIGWVHPFKDGNGRTANAFSYACLCLKLGALLPGRETVIDQIMADSARYEGALRAADQGLSSPNGKPDLRVMKQFLDNLLLRQIKNAEAEAIATGLS